VVVFGIAKISNVEILYGSEQIWILFVPNTFLSARFAATHWRIKLSGGGIYGLPNIIIICFGNKAKLLRSAQITESLRFLFLWWNREIFKTEYNLE